MPQPQKQELVFAPLGGVGEIGMNLSIYGLGDQRQRSWLAVDLGVSFATEEHLPGIDLILPDIRYLTQERKNNRRPHPHPRPRGSLWRADRPLAQAEDPGLCDALHRRAARRQMRQRAGRAGDSGDHRAARQPLQDRALRRRIVLDGAFDPGIERADHPHAGRHGAAYRRLENRSDADPRRRYRREEAAGAGRGGLPGAGRRFHQCGARGPFALGGRCRQDHRRAHQAGQRPRRRDHFRLQRGAPAHRGGSGLRRRTRGDRGRPRHGAGRADRAGDRLSRRRAAVPVRRRLRLSAAEQSRGAVHRQPGRGARGVGAHRRRPASGSDAGARRYRDLFPPAPFPATRRKSAASSTA